MLPHHRRNVAEHDGTNTFLLAPTRPIHSIERSQGFDVAEPRVSERIDASATESDV